MYTFPMFRIVKVTHLHTMLILFARILKI